MYRLVAIWIFIAGSTVAFSQAPRLVLPVGHNGIISGAYMSPDNKYVLTTSSRDLTAKLWEVNSEKLVFTFSGHVNEIIDACFSPDGRHIVTSTLNARPKVWNALTGQPEHDLEGESVTNLHYDVTGNYIMGTTYDQLLVWTAGGDVKYVVDNADGLFSADGKYLAVIKDGGINVYDLYYGRLVQKINGSPISFEAGRKFNEGKVLAKIAGGYHVWDMVTGKLINTLKDVFGKMDQFHISSNSNFLAAYSKWSDTVFVYETATGIRKCTVLHQGNLTSVDFTNDERYLLTASMDSTIRVTDVMSGVALQVLRGHKGFVWSAHMGANTNQVVSASDDATARIWDVRSGRTIHVFKGYTTIVQKIVSSNNGKYLATIWNNEVKVWESSTNTLLFTLKGHTGPVQSVAFSADSKYLLTVSPDHTIRGWDVADGKQLMLATMEGLAAHQYIYDAAFNNNGKLIIAGADDYAEIREFPSGKLKHRLSFDFKSVSKVCFTPDGKYFILYTGTPLIGETATGKILHTLAVTGFSLQPMCMSNNGKWLATVTADSAAATWEVATGKKLRSFKGHQASINHVALSPNDQYLATASEDHNAMIWETASGKLLHTLTGHTAGVWAVNFSKDGKTVVTASADKTAKIWEVATGKLLHTLTGHADGLDDACFGNNNVVYTASFDNSCKRWDAETGAEIFSWIALDATNYVLRLPDGYYQATPAATGMLHYITNERRVITFDQLDIQYNRPDKVLEALRYPDTALISSYRRAYVKRVRKLGIDTTLFTINAVPQADFTNRESVAFEQDQPTLRLDIHAGDDQQTLKQWNVWVNEVPVFGVKGCDIHLRRGKAFDTSIVIVLSPGDNRIETSVVNMAGMESYRMPLFVHYTPAAPEPEKFVFIGIGINRFEDTAHNLSWSVKDIRDLSIKLKSKYPGIIIDTLFDEAVTRKNVLAMKTRLQQLNEADRVIVSYSGHGLLSKELDYYLSTYAVDFSNPEKEGLSYEALEGLLDKIKPRKKLMLIDACHSGELDKEEVARIEASKKALDSTGINTKTSIKITEKKRLGMRSSFELMQNLFMNVSRGTGATIISAAGGMQYAQERGDLKNGVFTYSIIEAFNNNTSLTVQQLKQMVSERVIHLTNGLQRPTSRMQNNTYDWVVW